MIAWQGKGSQINYLAHDFHVSGAIKSAGFCQMPIFAWT